MVIPFVVPEILGGVEQPPQMPLSCQKRQMPLTVNQSRRLYSKKAVECSICKQAGCPSDHFLSKYRYSLDSDRKFLSKTRTEMTIDCGAEVDLIRQSDAIAIEAKIEKKDQMSTCSDGHEVAVSCDAHLTLTLR